jgi:hypothetical protein
LRQVRVGTLGCEESGFAPWAGHGRRGHVEVVCGCPAVLLGEDEVVDTVDFEHAGSFPIDAGESVQAGVGEVVVTVQTRDGEIRIVVRGVDQICSSVVGVFPHCHVSAVVAERLVIAAPRIVAVDSLAGRNADLGGAIVGAVGVEPHDILGVLIIVDDFRPLDDPAVGYVGACLGRQDMADTLPCNEVAAAVAVHTNETAKPLSMSESHVCLVGHLPATVRQPSLVLAKPIPILIIRTGTAQDGSAMCLYKGTRSIGQIDLRIESSIRCTSKRNASNQRGPSQDRRA